MNVAILLTQGGLQPAEGPGGLASWRHSGIFGCQQLLRDSWPAHTRMHANRFPRCMACMHGESWIEYSVSRIFHDFFRPRQYQNKLYTGTFTGTGTADFDGFRVHVRQFAAQIAIKIKSLI